MERSKVIKYAKMALIQVILVFLITEGLVRYYLWNDFSFPRSDKEVHFAFIFLPKGTIFDRYTMSEYDWYTQYHRQPEERIKMYVDLDGEGLREFEEITNKEGLRNDSCGEEILLIGDSFTYSFTVNNSYTITSNLCKDGYKVKNLGMPGFSTIQAIMSAKRELEKGKRPKKIIYLLYVGNDFRDNIEHLNYEEKLNGQRDLIIDKGEVKEIVINRSISKDFEEKIKRFNSTLAYSYLYSYTLVSLMMASIGPHYNYIQEIEENVRNIDEERMEVMEKLLLYADREFAKKSIEFSVFIIPTKQQCQEGKDIEINERISERFRKKGIKVYDFSKEYREICKREKIYWKNDLHFNEKGYKYTAEFIKRIIEG